MLDATLSNLPRNTLWEYWAEDRRVGFGHAGDGKLGIYASFSESTLPKSVNCNIVRPYEALTPT
jgi:hypothetical protein